jgi:DNA polymerase V
MSCKRLVIDGNVARLAFCNPDLPAFAVDELGEGVIWGVVRFSIRWHVARGQLS